MKLKLYTEEQVRKVLWEFGDLLFNNCQDGIKEDDIKIYSDWAIEDEATIELPSDEEIRKLAKEICKGHQHAMRYNSMLVSCFKMSKKVIHQILNQNKQLKTNKHMKKANVIEKAIPKTLVLKIPIDINEELLKKVVEQLNEKFMFYFETKVLRLDLINWELVLYYSSWFDPNSAEIFSLGVYVGKLLNQNK